MKTAKETNFTKEELLFPNRPETARAWIVTDPAALAHNLSVLRSLLSPDCRIMAVVKANAYGHGDLETARRLSGLGVDSFAVATLDEAVRLRKAKISGEILILGFTPAPLAPVLSKYHLSQTVVSLSHARSFCQSGSPVRVHVAVDTGMHRLGIPVQDTDGVCQALSMPWLQIAGMFTHLCAADSPLPDDQVFTLEQIHSFQKLSQRIRARGLPVPPLHYQSSYGILNYPLEKPKAAWARPGILLYGCLSENADEKRQNLSLRPVLSLFARVVCVRAVSALETVGYGRTYRAPSPRKIAVLSIGYADGIPRSLSGKGYVLLHGKKAPVAGRICMDQMTVDVTGIPETACGDTAVLIGQSGNRRILAEDLAGWAGTITNELLSRLGPRLPRLSAEKGCSETFP